MGKQLNETCLIEKPENFFLIIIVKMLYLFKKEN